MGDITTSHSLFANNASYHYQDPDAKLFKYVLPKITITDADSQIKSSASREDLQLIKTAVITSFKWLQQRWPDGYNLLMKQSIEKFQIVIVNYPDTRFNDACGRATSSIYSNRDDKSTIYVNAYDLNRHFNMEDLTIGVYHELMHAIIYLAVKDGLFIESLSGHVDKKYDGLLTNLANEYMNRQKNLDEEWANFWFEAVTKYLPLYKDVNAFCIFIKKNYAGLIQKHHCWLRDNQLLKEAPLKHNGREIMIPTLISEKTIRDKEEMLAEILTHYYGTDNDRKRLMGLEKSFEKIIKEVQNIVKNSVAVKKA